MGPKNGLNARSPLKNKRLEMISQNMRMLLGSYERKVIKKISFVKDQMADLIKTILLRTFTRARARMRAHRERERERERERVSLASN